MFTLSMNVFVFMASVFFNRITTDPQNQANSRQCMFGPGALPTSTTQNPRGQLAVFFHSDF